MLIALPVTGTLTMYISRAFGPAHSILAWLLLGLVSLHATAAIWHQFVLRDGAILRILPGPECRTCQPSSEQVRNFGA